MLNAEAGSPARRQPAQTTGYRVSTPAKFARRAGRHPQDRATRAEPVESNTISVSFNIGIADRVNANRASIQWHGAVEEARSVT